MDTTERQEKKYVLKCFTHSDLRASTSGLPSACRNAPKAAVRVLFMMLSYVNHLFPGSWLWFLEVRVYAAIFYAGTGILTGGERWMESHLRYRKEGILDKHV